MYDCCRVLLYRYRRAIAERMGQMWGDSATDEALEEVMEAVSERASERFPWMPTPSMRALYP